MSNNSEIKVIVTTSINHPTKAISKFDSLKDWKLIVVGDKKTPKNYKLKNGIYLTPKDQELIDKKLSRLIGWNCIERRNFGLIYAKKINASVIALIDDDNIPYKNWGKNLLVNKKINIKNYKFNSFVFDPFYPTEYKNLWHRGFPVEFIDKRKIIKKTMTNVRIDVQADFWNGDPDIDAICRLMFKPNCKFKKNNFPFISRNISPFNTQNTFISSRCLKNYFLFPGVGRMHDIWAAYYLQYTKKTVVAYNQPSVNQIRNKHDLIDDLKNEFIGLKNNYHFVNSLKNNNFKLNQFFNSRAIQSFYQYRKHFPDE